MCSRLATPADVRDLYPVFFARPVESDAVVEAHLADRPCVPDLVRRFLGSREYQTRISRLLSRLIIIQTADATCYSQMLHLVGKANRYYAEKHGVRYESFVGIKRGYFPWHACFNRLFMIKELMDTGYRGWLFYLDADAYVYDLNFNVQRYLGGKENYAMVAGPGGSTGERWDINTGVFFLNLGNHAGQRIADLWYSHFMQTSDLQLRMAANWEDVPNDQPRLHNILFNDRGLTSQIYIEDRYFLNDYRSSFVRQVFRGNHTSVAKRMEMIKFDIEEVLAKENLAESENNQ